MGNINNPGGTHTYGMFTAPGNPGGRVQPRAGGLHAEPIAKNVDFSTATTSTALNVPNQVMGLLVSGLTFMKISQMLNGQPIFERKSVEGVLFGTGSWRHVTERIQYCADSEQRPSHWALINDTYQNNGETQCCGSLDCVKGDGDSPSYAWSEPGTDKLNTMVTIGLKGGGANDAKTTEPVGIQPYYSNMVDHTKNASPQGGGE
mgnify:FL=1